MSILGIQSLTLALAVSMVIATGLIVGGISISAGNTSTDEARSTSDRGVAQCTQSGGDNVRDATARLILSILTEFQTKMLLYLETPADTAADMTRYLIFHHPDQMADPSFIDGNIRKAMFSKYMNAVEVVGDITLQVELLNSTPNSDTLSQKYNGAWGGGIVYWNVQDETGFVHRGVTESRQYYPDGPINYSPDLAVFGNSDANGYQIPGPCNYTPKNLSEFGQCYFSKQTMTPATRELLNTCFFNIANGGELAEPGVPQFGAIEANGRSVLILSCIPLVHPQQKNTYPNQGGRIGYVSSGVVVFQISKMMQEAELPQDSVLYAVEVHPKTKVVSTLAGANSGQLSYMLDQLATDDAGNEYFQQGAVFKAVEHTVDGDPKGTLSPVARHAIYMISLSNDTLGGTFYEELAQMPPGELHNWIDPNTSVLYWTRVSAVKVYNIHWYMPLLVPRDSVMSVIDEASKVIDANIAADKKATDDERSKSHTIMYCVTAVCVIVLLSMSVVFTNIIISPLKALSGEMAEVALMHTDAVNLTGPLSSLCEVSKMQQSFRLMVTNLVEYKNYMPQSILMETSEEEEEAAASASSSAASTQQRSVLSRSNASIQQITHQAVDLGLKHRTVSVIMINSVGWHNNKKKETEITTDHSNLIETFIKAVSSNKGTCDSFAGDRMMAYFNANRNTSEHRSSAVRVGLKSKTEVKLPLVFAVTTGDAKVGNMGITGMKKFSILSPIVPFAASLLKLCKADEYLGLIDAKVATHSKMSIDSRAAVLVSFTKYSDKPTLVFEALQERAVKEEEWMYQLETANEYAAWNDFVTAVVEKDAKAKGMLQELKGDFVSDTPIYARWRDACTKGVVDVLDLNTIIY
eukprot:TRINITY_DN1670_c0_g1_i4.p1 TRINITY_DN1670_c0_g1~~TRINITY_DN1670_c0_g1_i4.p1  ORF type:complete len:876 (+),score=166.97 TRINITY_DN1670_c0_g1_i4:41-2629(+)